MTLARMFGPRLERGTVTFRLWAPAAASVDLVVTEPVAMARRADGWFALTLANAGPGTQYRFRIDGALQVPDPASAFQPHDVGGASEVIDHDDYVWRER